jgi:lipooligosaccharide transport system ATP-binding protein
MATDTLIEARGLTKQYDDFLAVDNIDFEIYRGECCGFLGPNGAGKTTTIKMIHCVLPPASGSLAVAGLSVSEKAREIKRAEELLRFAQLEEKRDVVISQLSTGMKRRLILARALINEPQILLLDEPTTGLDPQGRHLIWDKIRTLKKQGVTIILTTHYMDEAAALCDRLLIMDNGKIIEEGTPAELVKKHIGEEVLEVDFDEDEMKLLKDKFPLARLEVVSDRIHVFTNEPHGAFESYIRDFPRKGAIVRTANLEDVFLKLTGRKLRE